MSHIRLYRFISIITLLCFLVFEYYSMSNIADMGDSSLRSFAKLIIELIAIVFLISGRGDTNTRFWVFWMIWNVFLIIMYFDDISGISSLVSSWFPQAAFVVGYICNKRCPTIKQYLKITVIPLLLIAIYFILNDPLNVFKADGEQGVDNLIFYIVCIVPFIMLIEKDSYKGILLVICAIMAVNSLKRNAMLMTAVFVLLYTFSVLRKTKGLKIKNMVIIGVLFFAGYYFLINNMAGSLEQSVMRFEAMQDDGGSGRTLVWKHSIDALSRNDLVSWVIGHGHNSTMRVARHTSAHNDFLTILIEQGIVGLLFYLTFVIKLFKTTWQVFKRGGYGVLSLLCICVIVLFMGMLSNLVPLATYFAFITFAYGIIISENKRMIEHQ